MMKRILKREIHRVAVTYPLMMLMKIMIELKGVAVLAVLAVALAVGVDCGVIPLLNYYWNWWMMKK